MLGNYIRPANNIEDRIDRRKAYKPNKRTVISLRQRGDEGSDVVGSIRTKTFVTKGESTSEIKDVIYNNVELASTIHADEHTGYDHFHAHYDMKRVNHGIQYKSEDGACNNQSEIYNSRFRRMQYGQCHKISNLYLSNYVNEIAYREENRRVSNGAMMFDIARKSTNTPTHGEWTGYWQGNKKTMEQLVA